MAVVINEFEAVAEAPASRKPAEPVAEGEAKPPAPIEPQDVAPALRELARRELRSWAH